MKRKHQIFPIEKTAIQRGTVEACQDPDAEVVSDGYVTVPCYEPRPGFSVADVARSLGGRLANRGEYGATVVAVVSDDGSSINVLRGE